MPTEILYMSEKTWGNLEKLSGNVEEILSGKILNFFLGDSGEVIQGKFEKIYVGIFLEKFGKRGVFEKFWILHQLKK